MGGPEVASTTFSARSIAPSPPWAKTFAVEQGTPLDRQKSWTTWSSSGESAPNWLMATRVGLSNFWAASRWAARLSSPRLDGLGIGRGEGVEGEAAVHLEGADRGDDHDGRGVQVGRSALDVEELLGPEVEGEAGLGHGVVAEGQGHPGREHRVAAVGDVGERPAVDERGRPFLRLDEVGQQGLLEDRREGAGDLHLAGQDGAAVVGRNRRGCGRAWLGGRSGESARQRIAMTSLAAVMSKPDSRGIPPWPGPPRPMTILRRARSFMSSARFQKTRPGSSVGVAEVEPVVDRGGQQVMSGGDRVEVAGELEVDLVRRGEPASPAAGRPSFAAEDRPHRRLPQGEHGGFLPILRSPCARPIEVVVFPSPAGVGVIAETRISLPGELSAHAFKGLEADLRLVPAVGLDVVGGDARGRRRPRRSVGVVRWKARPCSFDAPVGVQTASKIRNEGRRRQSSRVGTRRTASAVGLGSRSRRIRNPARSRISLHSSIVRDQ